MFTAIRHLMDSLSQHSQARTQANTIVERSQVVLTPEGFTLQRDCKEAYRIKWNEVREVFAFKHDMLAYDLITLGFRTTDDGSWYEVWEDCPGYEQLVAEVERRFDIIDKDWWSKVAFPMLQPNRTTLWGTPMPWPDD